MFVTNLYLTTYLFHSSKTEKEDTPDAMDGLSDSDLETLLKNFNELSAEEQHSLIAYLKKLEAREPQRVERLRQYVSAAATTAPPIEETPKPVKEEKPVTIESDDDDYTVEDIFKSVTQKVKEDQIRQEMEIVKKSLEESKDSPKLVEKTAAPTGTDVQKNVFSASDLLALVQASLQSTPAPTPVQTVPTALVSDVVASNTQPRSFGDLPEPTMMEPSKQLLQNVSLALNNQVLNPQGFPQSIPNMANFGGNRNESQHIPVWEPRQGPDNNGPMDNTQLNNTFNQGPRGPQDSYNQLPRGPQDNFNQVLRQNDNYNQGPRGPQDNFNQGARGPQDSYNQVPREPQENYNQGSREQDNYNSGQRGPNNYDHGNQDMYDKDSRGPQDGYNQEPRGSQGNFNHGPRGQENFHQGQRGSQDNFNSGLRGPHDNYNQSQRGPQNNFNQGQRGSQENYSQVPSLMDNYNQNSRGQDKSFGGGRGSNNSFTQNRSNYNSNRMQDNYNNRSEGNQQPGNQKFGNYEQNNFRGRGRGYGGQRGRGRGYY